MRRMWGLSAILLAGALISCVHRSSSLSDPEAVLQGWDQFRAGDFAAAASSFHLVLSRTPAGSPEHVAALYGLATTCAMRRPSPEIQRAEELYEEVFAISPKSDLAAWSLLGLARIQHLPPADQDPDIPRVRAAYQRVIDHCPDHPAGHEAFIYQQSTYVASMKPEESEAALDRLRTFTQQYPTSKFLSAAWGLQSACYETLNRPEEWLQAELNALETAELDPLNPWQDYSWSYWRIATIAEVEVGDFATARTYYQRLIDEYPEDIHLFAARQALERMSELEEQLAHEEGRTP